MKEFMLLIRNQKDHKDEWAPEVHEQFLKACESYIGELKSRNALIAAQPLVREGLIISGTPGARQEQLFNETAEMQVGYYHILAENLEAAAEIAKRNPEFAYSTTARIEVRPVKMKEQTTGFVYPKEN